jgi:LuxR family quorum-sensing system transcriptional regulator CciR
MVKILSLFTDAKDISSLSDSLGDAVLPLGFPCYAVTRIALTCYRSRPSISMEAICTHYPNNWVQHYLQHNYGAVDPVHRAAFTSSGPYRWADITDLSQNERHVLAEACDAGLKNGLSIPIREIGGYFAHQPVGSVIPYQYRTKRQLASVISNLFRLELDRLAPPHPNEFIQLSPRQRQCLSWVAQGKTSSDICMILKISRHTVEYHITEAMRVLNVNSRIAAVVIASNYGLLD